MKRPPSPELRTSHQSSLQDSPFATSPDVAEISNTVLLVLSATAGFWPGLLWLDYRDTGGAARRLRRGQCDAGDAEEERTLRLGTGHMPEGQNIHVSLIYGDYFFVEALAKLRGQRELFW